MTPQRRALSPATPRATTRTQARARTGATGALLHARRCVECGASMHHYKPARAKALEAATIVARLAASERHLVASTEIAQFLGPAGQPMPLSQVADHLTHAVEDGLLTRQRMTLPGGGVQYLYQPRIELAAYVEQESLAADIADLFGVQLRAKLDALAARARALVTATARPAGAARAALTMRVPLRAHRPSLRSV